MSFYSKDFEFEYYEKYHGCADNVQRLVEECPECGKRMFFTHQTDFNSLLIKETACCTHCDYGQRRLVSSLN